MLSKTQSLAAAALLVSASFLSFAGCDSGGGGGGGAGGAAEQTPEQKAQLEDMKAKMLKDAKVKPR